MNIRNILMVVSLALSLLIGMVIVRGGKAAGGATGGGASSKDMLIGFSMDTLKEARWQGDRDMFVNRCKQLGARVDVESANSDDSQQMRDVQSLITAGVKVLVVVPHDGVAMAKAVDMGHKAGIPVIAYDRLIRNSDLDLYLSFDNVKVGEMQAKYLVDHLPNHKGKIVRIYGSSSDNNAKLFKQGQNNIILPLVKSGDIQVVHEDWAEDWKPENAKKIVNAAITSTGGKFDGVLASNDGTAGGAIQSLLESGLAGKVLVTGQDAELAGCQRIASGSQSMTIYKPLQLLANAAAENAVKMAQGKPIVATQTTNNGKEDVPSVLEPVYAVDKTNMVQTVVKDNFHSYDEIYGNIPQSQRPPRS